LLGGGATRSFAHPLCGKSGSVTVTTRVGLVGAGNVARRHVAILLDLGNVEIAAVADPDIERARALAADADASRPPSRLGGEALDRS
jgi:ornithine cyclodeaminase/alanine dehydrogenase-like protein (mu-crystallin family)